MANRFVVHEANILAGLIVQIVFVVPATFGDGLTNCFEDSVVQLSPLTLVQVVNGMSGMKTRSEQDVLSNCVSQAGDELVLREQSLDATLFPFRQRVYEGRKVAE